MSTEVGFQLTLERIRAGARHYEIARAVGMAPPKLSLIENGHRPVAPPEIAVIRAAIRVAAGADGEVDHLRVSPSLVRLAALLVTVAKNPATPARGGHAAAHPTNGKRVH